MALVYQNSCLPLQAAVTSGGTSDCVSGDDRPIPVTRSSLPPLEEYIPLLEKIWQSRQVTNAGALHQQLEKELCAYLGVPFLSLFSSCTAALVAALKLLDLRGEVITTPYTFAATAHALAWCNLKPVFVDIDPVTANIDPGEIEKAITPQTCAILAVHCYGQPCDTDAIAAIAEKYNLKIIYDAAHGFAVEDAQGSILKHGNLSTVSFHGAKVFNTAEGGALICHDEETKKRIDSFKNFGFVSETAIDECGFNGKMSELNAALGIAQLRHIDSHIAARKKIDETYRRHIAGIRGIEPLEFGRAARANYSYFPIRVTKEYGLTRDELYEKFKFRNILTRRYFHPIITDFVPYRPLGGNTPIAKEFSSQILCLPIYDTLSEAEQMRVMDVLAERAA